MDQNTLTVTPQSFWSRNKKLILGVVLIFNILLFAFVFYVYTLQQSGQSPHVTPNPQTQIDTSLKQFASEAEFKDYLQKAQTQSLNYGRTDTFNIAVPSMDKALEPGLGSSEAISANRVSDTNVQVKGVDEPDIVKTNGKELFISTEYGNIMPMMEQLPADSKLIAPRPGNPAFSTSQTDIVQAFPPQDAKSLSEIPRTGQLLLSKNLLIVFEGQVLFGFDVSNPASPTQKWQFTLDNNNSLVTARLYNDKIYLVTRNYVDSGSPCPVPLSASIRIACTDIYYPVTPTQADSVFTSLILDSTNGSVQKRVSVVGSSGQSVVYMSPTNLYLTYSFQFDQTKFMLEFFKSTGASFLPQDTQMRLSKLESLDISPQAKLVEIQTILDQYYRTLSADDRLKQEQEMSNLTKEFGKDKLREYEQTGLAKINVDTLEVVATGSFPGIPLNQFALDEYNNHLRVASTIGQMSWGVGETVSDVSVFDEKLQTTGAVRDLGKGERIYSVRFLEDKGYLVTFKQVDPFYVLDLKDPTKPAVAGELKIPGYSSYLDPIAKDRVLGIGQEGAQVKLSLFDVSDPANPIEVDKYLMDEFWTEVQNNHHAFLKDDKHQVFFLPGGKGGYVFSFSGDKLQLTKAVSDVGVKRAVYIEDFLYIISPNKITILNEADWTTIKELTL